MWPLTTFLASTDSSIACDCIYLDAAQCHDAREAHVGHAAVSDSDSHDKDYCRMAMAGTIYAISAPWK